MSIRNWYIFIIFALCCLSAKGQNPQVNAQLSTDTMKIGEQAILTLQVQTNAPQAIRFPEIGDTLSAAIEILDVSKIDSSSKKELLTLKQQIKVTIFDSGSYTIPPFEFITSRGNKTDTIRTAALSINVKNIDADTTKAIKAIKTVVSIPPPPMDYSWMWWLLLLLPLGAGVYYLIKKLKSRPQKPKPIKPQKPAHIQALEALDTLEAEKMWQKDQFKVYHSRLTEIVRTYIEERFDIPAMEQTSGKVLAMLKQSKMVEQKNYERLGQLLHLADMVKFAKYIPIGSENELSMQNARSFINNTELKEQQPVEE